MTNTTEQERSEIVAAAKTSGATAFWGGSEKLIEESGITFHSINELIKFAELIRQRDSGQGEPIAVLALKNTALNNRIRVLEDLLSSAYNIAQRNGEQTHWHRFGSQLYINGISPITPKTFKILPSDDDYKPPQPQSVKDTQEKG